MAIRMKEWGILAPPGRSVQIPLSGIGALGASWGMMGAGVAAMGRSAAERMRERTESPAEERVSTEAESLRQVERTGHLAYVSEALKQAYAEAADELQEEDGQDAVYTLRRKGAAAVQDLMAELPAESRESARRLADVYAERAALQWERDRRVNRIENARTRWQQQVEAATEQGDEEQACRWLRMGEGIFVPEKDREMQERQTRSRCALVQWQRRLREKPEETLSALAEPTASLPGGEEERRCLQAAAEETRRRLRRECGLAFGESVLAGHEPAAEAVRRARQAGLLGDSRRLSHSCDWNRRVDEHEEEDADALRLEITAADLPLKERAALLRRLTAAAAVPADSRRMMSRALWNLYSAGRFGCTGDRESRKMLARLQGQGLELLQRGGKVQDWLAELRSRENHWVCFEA